MGERIQAAKQRFVNSKIAQHVSDNRTLYLTGATCLVAGFLGARRGDSIEGLIDGSNNFVGKAKHVTMVTSQLERRGHPGNIVRCLETGEVFASQQRAADTLGLNASQLAQHLSGKNASVKGLTFERLGEAA